MKKAMPLLAPYRGMRKEIYVIAVSRTINAMGALIHPFLTLLLSRKIGLSGGETGFYIALSSMMWGPASLIGGKLSDRYGRKKTLLFFESLAALGYLICMFIEPSMTMVYLIMANSFCFGVAGPSHDAMTADLTSPEKREGAYSLNYLGFNLGFAFAQVLAGFLFEKHLPLMFLIDGMTAGISLLLIGLFIPETLPSLTESAGKVSGPGEDEADQGAKSIFLILYERPLLVIFALTSFGYRFLYSCWHFLIPLHAEYRFPGEGAALYGVLGSFNAIIVVVMTPILTFLFRKESHIRRIFYAGILFTTGFGLLGFIDFRSAFFLSVLIFTLGEIMEAVSVMPYIMSRTPSSHRGRMSSVLPIIMGAGFVLGPMVLGPVLDGSSFPVTWHYATAVAHRLFYRNGTHRSVRKETARMKNHRKTAIFLLLLFSATCLGALPKKEEVTFPYEKYDYSVNNLILGIAFPPDADEEQRAFTKEQLDLLNIRHIRMSQSWHLREPENNSFNWKPLEDRLDFYSSSGVTVILTLETKQFPDWAADLSQGDFLERYRRYIRTLLEKYGSDIACIQTGNEWNWEIDRYLGGEDDLYIAMQNILYEEAERLSSENRPRVILGSLSSGALQLLSFHRGYLDNIYFDGVPLADEEELAAARSDLPRFVSRVHRILSEAAYEGVDLHFYDDYWNWKTHLKAFRQTLAEAGRNPDELPLLVTEFGGPHPDMERTDEFAKAERLVSYIRTLDEMDVDTAFFFKLVEVKNSPTVYHPQSYLIDSRLERGLNFEVMRRFGEE